jgi:hypothetical protein
VCINVINFTKLAGEYKQNVLFELAEANRR